MVETKHVAVEEPTKILRARFDLVLLKEVADDRRIGSPGEVQSGRAIGHTKLGHADTGKGLLACAAAVDERAIDIEQHESNHRIGKWERDLARVSGGLIPLHKLLSCLSFCR